TPSSSLGGNPAIDVPVPASAPPAVISKATPDFNFQKEWLERIEGINDGTMLEDALGKLTTTLGGRTYRRRNRGHKRNHHASSKSGPPVSDHPPAKSTSGVTGVFSSNAPSTGASSSTSTLQCNPVEASNIQKSFRANQRRTLQSILSGPPQYY
ncbi:hypothetical protein NPIL_234231, partial [Nephila pilipes]